VIKKPRERGGHSPLWAAEPEKIMENKIGLLIIYYRSLENYLKIENTESMK
jgi:hypothetical protein